MSQGWLYLSEHYLAFYSFILGIERKIMVELKSITELRKERSKKGLLADTIFVSTMDGRQFYFSNLFRRDETFDLLQSLTNKTMHRVLQAGSTVAQLSGSSNVPRSPMTTSSTLKEELDREQLSEYFSKLFRLPASEHVLDRTISIFWMERKPEETWRGELFLSTNFLAFFHVRRGSEGVSWTLPISCIKRLERIQDDHDEESQYDPYMLAITTCHEIKFCITVGSMLVQCNRFCGKLKDVLAQNIETSKKVKVYISRFPSEALLSAVGEDESLVAAENGFGAFHGYPFFDEK